jgi:peptidyl-prolyl cis-trans isomerase C
MSSRILRLAIASGTLVATLVGTNPALAQNPAEILASNPAAKVTVADYEASIQRIPEKDRFGFAMSQERIGKEIDGILRLRTIAEEARKQGLDKDPLLNTRVKLYEERLLSEALLAKLDAETIKEFESKNAVYIERAREQYLINKQAYQTPAQVKASHILVRTSGRSNDEALAKAKSLREKILAGASFEDLAATESDDPTATQNKGELGFFGPGQMDPAFEKAAFAMTRPGEVSEPVRSNFGYHIIRFEDRKEAGQRSFEDVKAELLDKAKSQFLDARRVQVVTALYDSSKIKWNEPAVLGLRKTVDPALYKAIEK